MTEPDFIAAPKVLLHDHLDGGLRPSTIVDLADAVGHELPSTDLDELVAYFRKGADSRDIIAYLDTFAHTVPLLQTADALERVAAEAAVDLAADGVVYAEVRFAPELHAPVGVDGALSTDAAVEAVVAGFARGCAEAAAAGNAIEVGTIVCAMRTEDRSAEIAELTLRWLGRGVVAFDLAGAETGFPPSDHAEALDIARRGLAHLTIHASEAPGLELIGDALAMGAERIGHGVRLIEDCERLPDGSLVLGPMATYVRDRQIPLELCPSCNVQIGAVPTIADHPVGPFLRAGLVATVNTDNRLMSGVMPSSELALVAETFALAWDEVEQLVVNAAMATFQDLDARRRLVDDVIRPGFAALA
ncbi:MAG: adenosine deaminase [Acidimicrobiales bacterium]